MRTVRRLPGPGGFLAALLLLGTGPLPDPRPALAQEGGGEKAFERRPIDEVLKGTVTAFDGSVVEVRYDFDNDAELEDFNPFKTFSLEGPFERRLWDHCLHIKGTGSTAWRVVARKGIEMEFEARYARALDVGAFVGEQRISEEYTLFSIYDQFFQNKDRKGSPKQHMIARFTMHAPDAGGDRAFRYAARKTTPLVAAGKPVKIKVGRQGIDDWMEIDGDRMTGNEAQWPALRGYRTGFYVLDNEAWITSVTLRGDVDPAWAKEAGIDLTLPVRALKAKPAKEPSAADRAALEKVARVRTGESPASGLFALIEDGVLAEDVREEAGKALGETGEPRHVSRLVPLLESQDVVCRRVADQAVTRLANRSFGFVADAPEEKRRKAVRALLDYIEKNPAKFR